MKYLQILLLPASLLWMTRSIAEPLDFVASPLTSVNSFTSGIEGPATDAAGNIYAVNFGRQHTIGKVAPDGTGEVFLTLPGDSVGNGIRFDRNGDMFVADYVGHTIYRFNPQKDTLSIFAHDAQMKQPNDLAITADGVLYASDPDWHDGTGKIWRIDAAGNTSVAADHLGTANGIDVSPDGKTLYVNESVQRAVWAFSIAADGSLHDKHLVKQFEDFGLDGMRTDVDGNLYVARFGKGTVIKMTPKGEILREVDVLGAKPSNLCFGGPDGRTVYITEVENKRIVQFRIDRPGMEWRRWKTRESTSPTP